MDPMHSDNRHHVPSTMKTGAVHWVAHYDLAKVSFEYGLPKIGEDVHVLRV